MVSFQCDGCADTVKKPQLDKHRQRCWASFTCLDCSTTFQNQDYKSHTQCISEAEKYQGKLYKGPKHKSNPSSVEPSAANSPAPSEGSALGIHPSRLNQMQEGSGDARGGYGQGRGRGGFGGRGGRGGFNAGRGGFGGSGYVKPKSTGENSAPLGGMRTWGSAANSESEAPSAPASTAPSGTATPTNTAGATGEGKDRKKPRKGDKGGTGAKANSRVNREGEAEPAAKKRKRDDGDEVAASTSDEQVSAEPSDKTLKRLKKHMGKLEEKSAGAVPLSQWLQQVAQGKEKTLPQAEILQGLKVAYVDGKWQLTA